MLIGYYAIICNKTFYLHWWWSLIDNHVGRNGQDKPNRLTDWESRIFLTNEPIVCDLVYFGWFCCFAIFSSSSSLSVQLSCYMLLDIGNVYLFLHHATSFDLTPADTTAAAVPVKLKFEVVGYIWISLSKEKKLAERELMANELKLISRNMDDQDEAAKHEQAVYIRNIPLCILPILLGFGKKLVISHNKPCTIKTWKVNNILQYGFGFRYEFGCMTHSVLNLRFAALIRLIHTFAKKFLGVRMREWRGHIIIIQHYHITSLICSHLQLE